MKVMLQGGAIAEYNDSYGARLIEQGKAVLAPDAPAKEETHADVLPTATKHPENDALAKGKRGNK